jgi:periplasmic protein TonB
MSRFILISVSVGFHAGLVLLLGEVRVEKARAATPIEIAEVAAPAPPPPPPPEPVKVEPEPPAPEPERRRAPPPPASAKAAAPEPEAPAAPSFDSMPDFGLALEGAVGGGGLAVPVRRPELAAPPPRVVKALAPPVQKAADACSEPASKPKPVSVPQPVYTDAARAASIEGRVRVELTVDEAGRVIEVKILQGLGHGLDEAALAAARSASFTPALRCGRPVRATFTIAMRFSAS